MKKIKMLNVIAIIITIVLSATNVSAAVNKDFVATNVKYKDLQKWNDSQLYNPDWGSLRLYMYHVKTSNTDPCTNCKFVVKPYDTDGNMGFGLTFQMGNDKTFPQSAGLGGPGTYLLGGSREDWTITNLGATIYGWFNIG